MCVVNIVVHLYCDDKLVLEIKIRLLNAYVLLFPHCCIYVLPKQWLTYSSINVVLRIVSPKQWPHSIVHHLYILSH